MEAAWRIDDSNLGRQGESNRGRAPTMLAEPDTDSLTDRLAGTTIDGKYRVGRLLGEGGMGAVFRVHHVGLRRDLALKVLRPELISHAEIAARFDREAHSAARLDHPNCLQVTDFGTTDDGLKYMVMQLLSGHELTEMLGRSLTPARAIELTLQILRGLEHAHGQGVAHRDLKPENVFVTTDHEGRELLKLVDFGIAKLLEGGDELADPAAAKLTRAGMVFGTPTYMSPEQAAGGDVDHRADLYSVGIILYQMLAGEVPFQSDDLVKLLRLQITAEPPPLPDVVPPALRAIVARLLSKERDDRFGTAAEVCEALMEARAPHSGTTLRPVVPVATTPLPGPTGLATRPPSSSTQMPVPGAGVGLPTLAPMSITPSRTRPPWRTIAIAAATGVLVLGLLGALMRDGNEAAPTSEATAEVEERPSAWEALMPSAEELPAAVGMPGPDRAALEEVDDALLAGRLDVADTKLTLLEDQHPDHPRLTWRRGRLLEARKDHAEALTAYAEAAEEEPELLDEPRFFAELSTLLERPDLRAQAVDVAIGLGRRGHQFLLERLADLESPLPLALRGRAVEAVREDPESGALIDESRQIAQDLLQAKDAAEPCEVAAQAIQEIADDPDELYLQPAHDARIPRKCKAERAALKEVRKTLVDLHGKPKRGGGGGNRCRGLRGVFGRGC